MRVYNQFESVKKIIEGFEPNERNLPMAMEAVFDDDAIFDIFLEKLDKHIAQWEKEKNCKIVCRINSDRKYVNFKIYSNSLAKL